MSPPRLRRVLCLWAAPIAIAIIAAGMLPTNNVAASGPKLRKLVLRRADVGKGYQVMLPGPLPHPAPERALLKSKGFTGDYSEFIGAKCLPKPNHCRHTRWSRTVSVISSVERFRSRAGAAWGVGHWSPAKSSGASTMAGPRFGDESIINLLPPRYGSGSVIVTAGLSRYDIQLVLTANTAALRARAAYGFVRTQLKRLRRFKIR